MSLLLPRLAGRRTFLRAFASLLLLEVAVLSGEWLVHQTEYLIVYSSGFGSVMSGSPHRLYIAPLGAALALFALVNLSLCALVLQARRHRYLHLRRHIPRGYRVSLTHRSLGISLRSIIATASILALCQVTVYLVQENLEAAAQGLPLPGVLVLVAPQYATVIPLHLIVALCSSTLLCTVSSLCVRSGSLLDTAERLVLCVAGEPHPQILLVRRHRSIARQRLLRGARGLRSPPAAA